MKTLAIALLAVLPLAVGCTKPSPAKPPVNKVGFVSGSGQPAFTTGTLTAGNTTTEPLTIRDNQEEWDGGGGNLIVTPASDGDTISHPTLEVQFFGSDMTGSVRSIDINMDVFKRTCTKHKLMTHVSATLGEHDVKVFCGKEY